MYIWMPLASLMLSTSLENYSLSTRISLFAHALPI